MRDWNDLRIVLALSRAGTLSAAAKELGLDQRATGRRLSAIEKTLGATLFRRTPRRLVPTEAGSAAITRALAVESELSALERQLENQRPGLDGQVRITVSEALSEPIARSLPGLRKLHPGIQVKLLATSAPLDLEKGEADLAVRFGGAPRPGLIVRKLLALEMGVYAAQSYLDGAGRAPSEGHALVAFDRPEITDWPIWRRLNTRVAVRASSLSAVKTALSAGLGIGALPRFLARESELVEVVPDTVMTVTCSLVVHPDLEATPRIRAVLEYLSRYLSERARELGGKVSSER